MGSKQWLSVIGATVAYLFYALSTTHFPSASIVILLNLVLNAAFVFAIAILLMRKSRIRNWVELGIAFLFVFYLYALHSLVTSFNLYIFLGQTYEGNHFIHSEQINLEPFTSIIRDLNSIGFPQSTIMQTVGNLFLLTPLAFGLLALGIMKRKRTVFLVTLLTTACIEGIQFLLNWFVSGFEYGARGIRAVDIDDIMLNTVSGVIGIVLFVTYQRIRSQNINKLRT